MTYNEFKTIIEEKFPEVTELQMEQFRKMEDLYRDWNSKINVISRKDIDELYRHHVIHSLGIAAFLRLQMPCLQKRHPYSAEKAYCRRRCRRALQMNLLRKQYLYLRQ